MPVNQLPIKQFFYFLILFICGLFAFVFYEFDQVEKFEDELLEQGFQQIKNGEKLSTLWDGILYFYTRDRHKELSKYQKNNSDIQINFEHQLIDTELSRGGLKWLPDIQKKLVITGRQNILEAKNHFICDSNLSTRNTKVQELGSFYEAPKLDNGLEVDRCYSEEAVNLLEKIKLPVEDLAIEGTVYPINGRLEVKIRALNNQAYFKQLSALIIYYQSLTRQK